MRELRKADVMALRSWLRTATIAAAIVMLCATANAQVLPATSLAAASPRLTPGDRVEIVTVDGAAIIGRLLQVSASGLAIDVNGKTVDLSAATVDQIVRRGDPIRNGVVRGTLIGGLSAVGVGVVLAGLFGEDGGEDSDAEGVLLLVGMGAGIGAGLGAVFDALRDGKSTVFKAESRQTLLVPIIDRKRKGAALVLRF